MRVTRDQTAIYLNRLNPGGLITSANREHHLVWWAACEPEHAGEDPSLLTEKAKAVGLLHPAEGIPRNFAVANAIAPLDFT